MTRTGDLLVMESFREPRPTTNPYIVMLLRSLRATRGLDVQVFSWRRALLGHLDVFHAHWPETLVAANSLAGRVARQALFAVFLGRLWLTRTPVVRTRHNLHRPSGISWTQDLLLRGLERLTVHSIVLNESTPVPGAEGSTLVRHGHYRDWFAALPMPDALPGRIGYFGLIRRYKGVDTLVEAFRDLPPTYSLRIAGNPSRPELVEELRALAGHDERITFEFHFLTDEELVNVARTSQLVVLPYPEMHNSGAVLAALSLDRPVLVQRNQVNDDLAREVGEAWVVRYEPPLSGAVLAEAMEGVPDGTAPRPDLSRREWAECGAAHLAAFRASRRDR